MNVYIWEYIDEHLTSYYHDGGGVVVVAKDLESARDAINSKTSMLTVAPENLPDKVYKLDESMSYEQEVFIFQDAGCC